MKLRSREIRSIPWLPAVLVALVWGGGAQAADNGTPPPGLRPYIEHAEAHHPGLAALEATAEAARQQARLDSALPGLKVAWGEMLVPVETRVGPQARVFSISQGLPWPGTLGAKKEAGLAEAAAVLESRRSRRAEILHAIRTAWYRLGLTQAERRLVEAERGLILQLEVSERARYESGRGSYRQLLAAQMEAARLQARLASLEDRIVAIHDQLLGAAGIEEPWPVPSADPPHPAPGQLPGRGRLLELLDRHSPELAALDRAAESRRHRLSAAGKARFPSLEFGLDFIQTDAMPGRDVEDAGKDPVVARVAATLPLWGGRAGAERSAATGRLQAAESRRDGQRLALTQRLDEIRFQILSTGRDLDLHESELLPRVRQLVDVTASEVAVSRADLTDLLAARRDLLNSELDALRAAHALVQARSQLESLLDLPWPRIAAAAGPGKASR